MLLLSIAPEMGALPNAPPAYLPAVSAAFHARARRPVERSGILCAQGRLPCAMANAARYTHGSVAYPATRAAHAHRAAQRSHPHLLPAVPALRQALVPP